MHFNHTARQDIVHIQLSGSFDPDRKREALGLPPRPPPPPPGTWTCINMRHPLADSVRQQAAPTAGIPAQPARCVGELPAMCLSCAAQGTRGAESLPVALWLTWKCWRCSSAARCPSVLSRMLRHTRGAWRVLGLQGSLTCSRAPMKQATAVLTRQLSGGSQLQRLWLSRR